MDHGETRFTLRCSGEKRVMAKLDPYYGVPVRNGSWRNSTHTTVFRCEQDTDGHGAVRPTLRCSGKYRTQRVIAKHGLHYGVLVRNRSWRNPANTTLFRCEQDTAGHSETRPTLRCSVAKPVLAKPSQHYVVPVRTGHSGS